MWTREEMAQRAAQEIMDGQTVNLGIGIPTLVANFLDGRPIFIHSENGILGMGPYPTPGEHDPQIINAGKETVTIRSGGSTFDSNLSFAMIRGGHIDLAILGAMQVDQNGDLANWAVPGAKITGMGGAMDLATGANRLICLMNHCDKSGEAKLVEKCTLPLTGIRCVNRVITELGVLDIVVGEGFRIVETAPGVTPNEIRGKTSGLVIN